MLNLDALKTVLTIMQKPAFLRASLHIGATPINVKIAKVAPRNMPSGQCWGCIYLTGPQHQQLPRYAPGPRSIIPTRINQFTSQTPLLFLVIYVHHVSCNLLSMYSLCVYEAIDILYSYPPQCPMSLQCWLCVDIYGSVIFPILLHINIETPYWLSKRTCWCPRASKGLRPTKLCQWSCRT